MVVGDKRVNVSAGRAVTVSRGVPHAWSNVSDDEVRMLVVFSPGYVEGMFREIALRAVYDVAAILEKFGCLIVGPPPSEGLKHVLLASRVRMGAGQPAAIRVG